MDEDDLSPTALGARLAEEWIKGMPGGVVLAGHSASCQIVTQAALLCPDRVSAVVLVGPTTDPRASSWRRITARWLRTAVWERPGQVPLLAQTYTRTGLIWMWRAMDAARREDLRAALRTLQCRVLVARGQHDRICPEPWTDELVAVARAGSASVTLDAGAHMVPLTHGELLAAVLRTAVG